MASTQLQTTSPQQLKTFSAKPLPLVVEIPSFYSVVERGNKVSVADDVWEFRILDVDEAVGYMRDCVLREMIWDKDNFSLDYTQRRIVLRPEARGEESDAEACQRAFSKLCLLNKGRFNNCFDVWLAKNPSRREFQPVHVADTRRQDLAMPLPMRGLFGIVTLGVHLNVYTTRKVNGREAVDKIWVSHRASSVGISYPGMLDQIVAGGMDPCDRIDGHLAPCVTLKREAEEESGLLLDLGTKSMSVLDDSGHRKLVGTVETAPVITFYDCKAREAGRINQGHLEPGVRFVYDLRLDTTFHPRTEERGIAKFEMLTPDEVKRSLPEQRWKPNCGLVMLDFLMRKGLVHDEDAEKGLRRRLPFRFVEEGLEFLRGW